MTNHPAYPQYQRSTPERLLILLILLILCCGCNGYRPPVPAADEGFTVAPDQMLISLYLAAVGKPAARIAGELAAIEISDGRLWLPLTMEPATIDNTMGQGQQLLALADLPPADYTHLRLTFSTITVNGQPWFAETMPRELELPLAGSLHWSAGSHCCLFLDWHQISLTPPDPFWHSFAGRWQALPLSTDLVTVICDRLNTVYQISPDRNQVVGTLRLPGELGESAYNDRRQRCYILGIDNRRLYVIDASTSRLVDGLPLPAAVAPRFLVLSPDGRFAYVSDPPANRITKLNLESGFVETQNASILGPSRLLYRSGADRHDLVVAVPDEQAVYLLDPETLGIRRILALNRTPRQLLTVEDRLYVTDDTSSTVGVYQWPAGTLITQIQVGRSPGEMAANAGRLYVCNVGDASISLILPRQNSDFRRLPAGATPVDLAISPNWQKLYIANRDQKKLTIRDLHTGTLLATVPLGDKPREITLWEP
ncbi:MAG: hypothetical protein JXO49_00680 [Deltaproteobacteria bacterium]|nr:hypothetical protein [Candidatus Anaeroferrophillus wilburensis]MBN2887840.1 hypothetical protein [Deltaproteobacteria bacterium]